MKEFDQKLEIEKNVLVKGEPASNGLLRIPDGVTGISKNAIKFNKKIQYVFIPASVDYIGKNAFKGCSGIKAFKVDEKNQYLKNSDDYASLISKDGKFLFAIANSNNKVYKIPQGVERIDDESLLGIEDVEEIIFPDSVKRIAPWTFLYNGLNLKKVTFGKGIEKIGEHAMDTCLSLKEIVFPKKSNLISIHETALPYESFKYVVDDGQNFVFTNDEKMQGERIPIYNKGNKMISNMMVNLSKDYTKKEEEKNNNCDEDIEK